MILRQTFDYIVRLSSISIWYYVIAVGIGALSGRVWEKWKVSLLLSYCLIIFSIAVLNRKSGNYGTNFEFFYKYKHSFNDQILANILLFIPIGMVFGSIGWKWVWIGMLFSALIEVSQLLFHRGMFDVDDIVSNCLGIAIGIIIFFCSRKVRRHIAKKK